MRTEGDTVQLAQQFGTRHDGGALVDRQRQFTMRDLLLLTFSCGFGLFAYRRFQSIPEALITGIGMVVVAGIITQARDLAYSWRRCSPELRGSMLFSLTWRIWLAALLTIPFVAAASRPVPGVDLPHFLLGWHDLPVAVVLLSLLIIVGPFSSNAHRRSWLGTVLLYAGGTAGLLTLLVGQAMFYYLVYLAVRGIEADQPLHLLPQPIRAEGSQHPHLFWVSTAALLLIPLLLWGVAGVTARLSRKQPVWAPLLVLAAALLLAWSYAVWFYGWALPGLSTSFASAMTMKPLWAWLAGVALAVTFTGALAYRCVCQTGTLQHNWLQWRDGGIRYLHEHPLTLGITSVAAFWLAANILRDPGFSWEQVFLYAPERSVLLLAVALGLVAASATFRVRGQLLRAEVQAIKPLPMRRLLGIWSMMLLVLTTAAMILAAASFAVWLNPWMLDS